MAVIKAPVRQQSYLTEYDRQMAEYLRKMGGSIGAQDIAAEAYGGKFPVGTMTAKILSGVLAGASDRRAVNREERSKDSYSKAREIAIAMENPQLSTDGSTMSVNPNTGNFEYLPTGEQTTSVWGREKQLDEMGRRADAMGNYLSGNLSPEQEEEARIAYESQGPLPETFEASPYSSTGIPYASKDITEDMRYTVGEKAPEDSTQLGRFLRGTLPQDVLPINAEKALSQALRGANVPEFQFDEYRQNKRIQDMANARAEEEYQYNLAQRGTPEVQAGVALYDSVSGKQIGTANEVKVGKESYFTPKDKGGNIVYVDGKPIRMSGNMTTQKPDKKDALSTYDKSYAIQYAKIKKDNPNLSEEDVAELADTKAKMTVTQELDPGLSQEAIKNLTDIESKTDIPSLDIRLMSKADVMGAYKGAVNFATGLRGGKVPYQDQVQAGANLEAINNKIKIEMVKEISARGSVYTQKKIEDLLPSTKNSDASNYAKIQSLIPLLKNKLEEAEEVLINSNTIYPNDKKRASKALQDAISVKNQLQQIIPVLNDSIIQFDSNYSNTKNPFTEYTYEEFNNVTKDDLKEDN